MLRRAPFDKIGVTPTPDFQNADPANGIAGSIVNGLVFNDLQHEGENLELLAGLTPSSTDLTQWAQAVSRGIWAGNLTGTGDLAVATLGVVIPDFLQGMRIGAIATATNTVTNPKLRVTNKGTQGGYTDYPILKVDGTALAAGDIKAGRIYRFEADGTGNVLITGGGLSAGGSSGSGADLGVLHLQRTRSTSTAAITLSQNTPTKAPLNTLIANTITGASADTLTNGNFVLPAGTYDIDYGVFLNQAAHAFSLLYSETDAAVIDRGGSIDSYSSNNDGQTVESRGKVRLVLSATKTLHLRALNSESAQASGSYANGFIGDDSSGTTSQSFLDAQIFIRKVA